MDVGEEPFIDAFVCPGLAVRGITDWLGSTLTCYLISSPQALEGSH